MAKKTSTSQPQKFSIAALTALVVGSMIGAGVFSLPSTFAQATGGLGALIAWLIAGTGMLMMAFVFQSLAQRKPDLDSGIYAYAEDGFGKYFGFISAFGFWAGTCVGNVSYFILIKSTLGAFFPVFGDGNTIQAILVASVLLWGFHFLILKGVKGAAVINSIATFAKIVPLFVFIVIAIFAFKPEVFKDNFLAYNVNVVQSAKATVEDEGEYGHLGQMAEIIEPASPETLASQVRNTMLVTVFVFLGIEGASVYSRYAKKRKDVGVATVLGFLGVLVTFILVTMLSYGVLSRAELAALRQPSVAGVLESIVGHWGAVFISIGLIVSVLGAYLSWTLLASEVLFSAAKNKAFPRFLTIENKEKVPVTALWLTSIVIQVFLILTFFVSQAFTLALELTSALSLIPYLLVAAYALKLAWTKKTYEKERPGIRKKELLIAVVATIYSLLMIYAGGMKYVLLSALIYAPGSILFLKARREQRRSFFMPGERVVFGLIVAAAGIATYALSTGLIII